ncbi:hypothetical protein [Candidatus Ornithobacterium hominis]|uniref:hypothetical protein n=1 Tax=Candidatus Ornithobacterium hominis TaxID=2497989 RepID=UPI001058F4F6|nr:hypothetical protein [Candidatus Ornithobacterium hominis]
MAFTLTPLLVYREYSEAPNAHILWQTLYVVLAFWVLTPMFTVITSTVEHKLKYKGLDALIVFGLTLMLWEIIIYTSR